MQGLCKLVARCLNKDADTRPTASELLKDPIFKQAHDGKWLAKRLFGAADKSSGGDKSRRVTFKDGREGTPPGSVSPRQHSTVPVSPFCKPPWVAMGKGHQSLTRNGPIFGAPPNCAAMASGLICHFAGVSAAVFGVLHIFLRGGFYNSGVRYNSYTTQSHGEIRERFLKE